MGYDDIHLAILFLKFDLLCRSLDLTSFNSETSFQKDLNYFLPFFSNFFCCTASHNDVMNVFSMFRGITLFQCSPD